MFVTQHQVTDNPKHLHMRFHVRDEYSPPTTSIQARSALACSQPCRIRCKGDQPQAVCHLDEMLL